MGDLLRSALLRGWTADVVLFTDGDSELPAEEGERIRRSGIVVREEAGERLVGSGRLEAVVLRGGEVVPRAGLFVAPRQELRSDLHVRVGCALSAQGASRGTPAAGRASRGCSWAEMRRRGISRSCPLRRRG